MGKHTAEWFPKSRAVERKQQRRSTRAFQPVPDRSARIAVQWFSRCGLSNAEIEKATQLKHHFVWTWAQRTTPEPQGKRGPAPLIGEKLAEKMKRSIVKVRFKASHHLLVHAPKNPRTGEPISVRSITRALHRVGALEV
jgi:transposase